MSSLKRRIRSLVSDEQGAEVLEYALVAGLIVVVSIVAIATFGGYVKLGWTYVSSKL